MVEGEALGRVEVDPQFVGMIEVLDPGIPRVEVEDPELHLLDDVGGVLDVGHVAGTRRGKLHRVGVAQRPRGTLGEEEVLTDPAGPALQRCRTVPHSTHRTRGAQHVVLGDVALGPTLLREQHLVGT